MKLQRYNRIISSLIGLLLFCTMSISTNAQIYYNYDNNGNRIADDLVVYAHRPIKKKQNYYDVKVYPNPASEQVNISIASNFSNQNSDTTHKSTEPATLYLSDASGNILSTQKLKSNLTTVNLAKYNQGTFYIKIILEEDEYTFQVMKTNTGRPNPNVPQPGIIK